MFNFLQTIFHKVAVIFTASIIAVTGLFAPTQKAIPLTEAPTAQQEVIQQKEKTFALSGREIVLTCPANSCNSVYFAYNSDGYFYPNYKGVIETIATIKKEDGDWYFIEINRKAGAVYGDSESPIYFNKLTTSGWLNKNSFAKDTPKYSSEFAPSESYSANQPQKNLNGNSRIEIYNPPKLTVPNYYYYPNEKVITRDEAVDGYWYEIKDYVYGSKFVEVFSYKSANYYTLLTDISGGSIDTIYFPSGGYLYLFGADFDSNGYAFGVDLEGNGWDINLDMNSSIVDNAIEDWASDNTFTIR